MTGRVPSRWVLFYAGDVASFTGRGFGGQTVFHDTVHHVERPLTTIVSLAPRPVVNPPRALRRTDGCVTLRDAVDKRKLERGELLHHSDRCCQYTPGGYQQALKTLGIVCSMSCRGECYDNAVDEQFFWSLKHEWANWREFDNLDNAQMTGFEYIETLYTAQRGDIRRSVMSPVTSSKPTPPQLKWRNIAAGRCPKVLGYCSGS